MNGLDFWNKWKYCSAFEIGNPSELAWWLFYQDENNKNPTMTLGQQIRCAEDYLSLTTEKNPMVVDRAKFIIKTLRQCPTCQGVGEVWAGCHHCDESLLHSKCDSYYKKCDCRY